MNLLPKKLSKFGSKPGLERMTKIMKKLGNPEQRMKVILVTGTNGKGSVTSFLSAILAADGYKVGSYFSPHLLKYNERFKINGKDISDAKLKKYEKIVLALFAKKYSMTEFEALTAIAYKYFADENCDFAIMEIGMGGRLDATNIAEECLSIITNVDLEHTDYLGDTIEKVASEKAGIMKKGIAITGAKGNSLEVIKEEANRKNIQLFVLNEDFFGKPIILNSKKGAFNYVGADFFNALEIKLIGRHQIDNAALAVAAAEQLGVEEEAIKKGLKKATNPARLQLISKSPKRILVDAAHNPHGMRELIANLNLFDYDKLVCVFGVMKDKDWKEMLKTLAPHCDLLITNQPKAERSESADAIANEASQYVDSIAVKDVKKSLLYAKKKAKKNDLILVCGSIYMIGELIG
jgi:dihydrofolate synthase/folylpolyglutamate synthase